MKTNALERPMINMVINSLKEVQNMCDPSNIVIDQKKEDDEIKINSKIYFEILQQKMDDMKELFEKGNQNVKQGMEEVKDAVEKGIGLQVANLNK